MTIRLKLLLAFSAIVLLAASVAVYGLLLISSTSAMVVRLYDGPMMAVNYARAAQLEFAEARRIIEKAIVLREAPGTAELAAIDVSIKKFSADMAIVQERIATATGFNEGLDKIKPLVDAWYKEGMSYLKPPAGGVTQLPLASDVIAKGNVIRDALDAVVENASAYGFNFRSDAETTAVHSKTNLLLMAAAVMVVGLGLAIAMAASFSRPIRYAMSISEEIANGNFTAVVSTTRRDELGRLIVSLDKTRASLDAMEKNKERERAEQLAMLRAEVEDERKRTIDTQNNAAEEQARRAEELARVIGLLGDGLSKLAHGDLTARMSEEVTGTYRKLQEDFNATVDRLAQTMSEIVGSTAEVSNAAAEISASTTDLSQRTEEQAAGLAQTNASLQQISTTVKQNAEHAQRANDHASSMQKIADDSSTVVDSAVSAMAKIEESSNEIADIIGVIDEIARQTNLLALNAAVEAARAGEAGRGFAVVAAEVRSLAQRSAQAAKDIKNLIGNSTGQVKNGVELVNKAGAALQQIIESIHSVSKIVADIAATTGEQAQGIDQVTRALAQVDEVTQQNSALVEENAATAKALEQQSVDMAERVAFFKLGAEEPAQDLPQQRPAKAVVHRAA